jgi:(2Fe-2S) ferredoxin
LYIQKQYNEEVPTFTHHIFICTNERPSENPKGSCKPKGSEELVQNFKDLIAKKGLKTSVRAQKAGCLDACEHGPSVVVYPEGVWYGRVKPSDVQEIVEQHLIQGKPVKRLILPPK